MTQCLLLVALVEHILEGYSVNVNNSMSQAGVNMINIQIRNGLCLRIFLHSYRE